MLSLMNRPPKVTVDTIDLNLKSLKSMACDFVAEKCPTNGITRMQERVLLFKHDYHSTNILQVRHPTMKHSFWEERLHFSVTFESASPTSLHFGGLLSYDTLVESWAFLYTGPRAWLCNRLKFSLSPFAALFKSSVDLKR